MTEVVPWDCAGTGNCGLSAPALAVGLRGVTGLCNPPAHRVHAHGCNQLPKPASNTQQRAPSRSVSAEFPAQKATGDPSPES